MKISPNVKPALWGTVGGAIAFAIVGFTGGAWVTSSLATTPAKDRVTVGIANVLAPMSFLEQVLSNFDRPRSIRDIALMTNPPIPREAPPSKSIEVPTSPEPAIAGVYDEPLMMSNYNPEVFGANLASQEGMCVPSRL